MQDLASILANAPGNPYQSSGTGGGISPLLMQMVLAQQMGNPSQQSPMGQTPTQGAPVPQGQPVLPQGIGSLGALGALMPPISQ